MGRPKIDLIGKRFTKLVVVGEGKKKASNGGMYWYCKCDCGNYTEVAANHLRRKSDKRTTSCGRCPIESVNTFKLSDCGAYYIGTTRTGKDFLFDLEDYEEISKHSWCFDFGYIGSFINGKKIRLHQFIMKPKRSKEIDHKNNDKTDNRRSNLRICNNQQNCCNKVKKANTSSKYKGVTWWKRDSNWRAVVRYKKKIYRLGYFATEEEAAKAYNQKALELHGEYAKLNIIET